MKFLSSYRIMYHGNKSRQNLPITAIDLVKCTFCKNGALGPVMMFILH